MNKFARLAKRIESFRDEMVNQQIKLCAMPAIAPSNGGEGEVQKARLLTDFLKQIPVDDIELINAPDMEAPAGYRPNILAVVKGQKSARTAWIMTHMDVVPPGELAQWEGDPFKAWVRGGKVFGRGVEDNQQDQVASLFAVKALRAEKILPSWNVGIALVADEETGSLKGIDYVLRHSKAFRPKDLIIVPDAGNKDGTLIEVAEKGILWLKIKTVGRQAHASTPEKGINSFKAASFLVTQLDSLHRTFGDRDPLFEPPISTFEPTKKEANVPNINTIPGEDVFYLDSRVLPKYSLDAVEAEIRKLFKKTEKKFGVTITSGEQQRAPAAPPTSAKAPVVTAIRRAVKDVYGAEAKPRGIGGGTVAAVFRRAGYEAACWSKTDETAHQPNEYCHIDNLVGDAKVFAHIFLQE
ncbi:MAG: diaminopimelate aminotransferase [Candidatus Aminicenantes bacterium RBG_16_63_16]|nr:MAG: diaminopimelate aminotransferase [Candidatus Aminicenantes bacterium RBG_16_63_16]